MKKYVFYLCLLAFPLAGRSQADPVKISLFNNKILLLLPPLLNPAETIKASSTGYVFINKEKTARLTVTYSADEVTDNDIPSYTDEAISAIKHYPETAVIYDDGISLNAGKNIGYIKYGLQSGKEKGFNIVFYGSMDDKPVTFYFNCPGSERTVWEKKIDDMIAALRIEDIKAT